MKPLEDRIFDYIKQGQFIREELKLEGPALIRRKTETNTGTFWELSKRALISPGTISRILSGQRVMSPETYLKILGVL